VVAKNFFSLRKASWTRLLVLMSNWERLTTPQKPRLRWISSFISIFFASTPLSMMSILVMTPMVRVPFWSMLRAICNPSEVVMSWLAGNTTRMMVRSSSIYRVVISLVTRSMSLSWPEMGTLVMPGKSMRVRSGQVCE